MANLSKASFTPRTRPPRRDMYEVPPTAESEEPGRYALQDDNSPNEQLLREANTSPPPSSIPPPDVTPDRPAPANDSTSSRKSVHFQDPVATESAGLLSLAVANKARGRPKGKLVRPSSDPAPISLKKAPPPLPVKETRRSERVQVNQENASLKPSSLQRSLSDAQTSSPSTNDNGERRSGRWRPNVATYNDTENTRASAGYKRPEVNVTTLPAKAHKVDDSQLPPTKTKSGLNLWTKEEIALLKRLHREGLTVQEMIKHFDGRSYSAITGRYARLKLGPVNKASRNLDTENNRKRKTTAEVSTFISLAKRRRIEELSVSSSPSSQRSKPDAMPATSPVQLIRNRSSYPPASSPPSTPRSIENPSKQNSALSPTHRKEPPRLVEGETPKEPGHLTKSVQNRALEEKEAADEKEADDSNTPEAQAHALIQENYGRDGGNSPASGSDDNVYLQDRNDSALDMEDDDPDAPLMHRLFRQFAQLKEVVVSVISLQAHVDELNLRRPVESPFEDFDTLRRKIRMSYKALLDPSTEEDAVAAQRTIKKCITKLQHLVKDLDPDAATVRRPQRLLKNIYAFVFPDLLKILATASYNLLVRTESDEDIVSSDFTGLIDIARCITSLGSRALKWKTKVDPDLALVKPVKNEIVAPLKKILREFERHHDRLEAEEEETGTKLRRSQEVKRLRAEREVERERIAKLASKGDRMRVLYMWRANVESDLVRRFERLAMPNLRRRNKLYPLDANGQPFEREAVFKPRSSIPHMDRPSADDDDEDWTEEELEALQEGLAEIPHDKLFWKKFYREYCHYRRNDDGSRGGPLRDRTVAEILKEMVRFRDYSIEDEAELPEWLSDIPDMDLVPFL